MACYATRHIQYINALAFQISSESNALRHVESNNVNVISNLSVYPPDFQLDTVPVSSQNVCDSWHNACSGSLKDKSISVPDDSINVIDNGVIISVMDLCDNLPDDVFDSPMKSQPILFIKKQDTVTSSDIISERNILHQFSNNRDASTSTPLLYKRFLVLEVNREACTSHSSTTSLFQLLLKVIDENSSEECLCILQVNLTIMINCFR